MAKIAIGKAVAAISLTDKVIDAGHSFKRAEDGEGWAFTVDLPGVKTQELSRDDLSTIVEVLSAEDPQGDSPGAVFARTATVDNEGNLSARFSDSKGSRTVTVPAADRDSLAEHFLSALLGQDQEALIARLEAVEAEAAQEAAEKAAKAAEKNTDK